MNTVWFVSTLIIYMMVINWPCQAKTSLRAYEDSEDPDKSAHPLSDQGLPSSLIESLHSTKCMNGERRPVWYLAHAQDDPNLRILRMFEGTFSLEASYIMLVTSVDSKQTVQMRIGRFLLGEAYNIFIIMVKTNRHIPVRHIPVRKSCLHFVPGGVT